MGRVFINGLEQEPAGQNAEPPDFRARLQERVAVLHEVLDMLDEMQCVERAMPYSARVTGAQALLDARQEIMRRIETTTQTLRERVE
jgi:hypothetical protein